MLKTSKEYCRISTVGNSEIAAMTYEFQLYLLMIYPECLNRFD